MSDCALKLTKWPKYANQKSHRWSICFILWNKLCTCTVKITDHRSAEKRCTLHWYSGPNNDIHIGAGTYDIRGRRSGETRVGGPPVWQRRWPMGALAGSSVHVRRPSSVVIVGRATFECRVLTVVRRHLQPIAGGPRDRTIARRETE